jgi:hypothetical protein
LEALYRHLQNTPSHDSSKRLEVIMNVDIDVLLIHILHGGPCIRGGVRLPSGRLTPKPARRRFERTSTGKGFGLNSLEDLLSHNNCIRCHRQVEASVAEPA